MKLVYTIAIISALILILVSYSTNVILWQLHSDMGQFSVLSALILMQWIKFTVAWDHFMLQKFAHENTQLMLAVSKYWH